MLKTKTLSPMTQAIRDLDIPKVTELSKTHDMNEIYDGFTPLMQIVGLNMCQPDLEKEMFNLILSQTTDLEKKQEGGLTAFGLALSFKRNRFAYKILEKGANPNVDVMIQLAPGGMAARAYFQKVGVGVPYPKAKWCRLPALCAAVYRSDEGLVRKMVEHGAQINVIGELDVTPLSMSVRREDVCLTRYLLEQGANPNVLPMDWRNYAQSEEEVCPIALKKALKYGNVEALDLLMENNVRIPATFRRPDGSFTTPLTYLLSQDSKLQSQTCLSAMHLIWQKVNLNGIDSLGRNAASYAAESGDGYLLMHLLTPENRNQADVCGLTPMMYAFKERHFNAMEVLFQAGVSMNNQIVDKQSGMNMLMISLTYGDVEMTEFLLKQKPNLLQQDANGLTVLDYAPSSGPLADKIRGMYNFQLIQLQHSQAGKSL